MESHDPAVIPAIAQVQLPLPLICAYLFCCFELMHLPLASGAEDDQGRGAAAAGQAQRFSGQYLELMFK
jgi:hypothetical protein